MSREQVIRRAPAPLRPRPTFELRLQDAVVAQKPLWQVTATGFAAAALLWWFLPVFCVINVLFLMPAGVTRGWVEEIFTSWLFPFLGSVWPLVAGSLVAGAPLGALRAWSARKRMYFVFMRMRLGFDAFAAAGLGVAMGIWASLAYLDGEAIGLLGGAALGAGCLYYTLWRRCHDAALRWFLSEEGVDYAREIKEYLLSQKQLGEFELFDVTMDEEGCVDLYGVWPDRIVQGSIETALGKSREVRGVRFHNVRV